MLKKKITKNKSSKLRLFIILIIFLGAIFNFTPFFISHAEAWYSNNWAYRKTLTFDSSQMIGQLSNFPVCINITDPDLTNVSFSDGRDILFTTTADVKLSHEIEYFKESTGKLVVWVKIPSFVAPVSIYMYYHNPGCSNQSNPTGVWDSHYLAVYHMVGQDWDYILDSTSNNHDAISEAQAANYNQDGLIGKCVTFDGSFDYISIADSADFTFATGNQDEAFSIEAIYKKTDTNDNPIIGKYGAVDKEYMFNAESDGRARLWLYDNSAAASLYKYSSETLADTNKFHYIAATYDGSEAHAGIWHYINGSKNQGTGSKGAYDSMEDKAADLTIGWRSNQFFKGSIDEIRISDIVRAEDWIETTYNNINNATDGGFYTIGSQTGWLTAPNPPSNFQATVSANSISLSWSKAAGVNFTYIERNTSEHWALGEGILVYNGSGSSKTDHGLDTCTQYFYQAWSIKSWNDIFVFSTTNVSVNATTISSLLNPTINVNLSSDTGFNIDAKGYINVSAETEYNVTLIINISVNNESFNTSIKSGNTTSTYSFNLSSTSHSNPVSVKATDPCGNFDFYNTTFYIYHINCTLIDEETGTNFSLANCDGLNVSVPSKNINYDMHGNNTITINYTSYTQDTLHFEIDYNNVSGTIFRYIRIDLVEPVIRIGVAREQEFFQQLFYSSITTKKVAVKNVFANCYVLADVTRFTYGDAYMTSTYTIDKLYYLYTYDSNGNKVILASIDGSQSIVTNLDLLEFANATYDFGILGEDIAFSRYNNYTIMIYYLNLQRDNTKTTVDIYNNNTKIFTHTELDDPDNITIYFNYATLTLNGTIIKVVVRSYKEDGSIKTFTRYYDLAENRVTTDVALSAVMIVISILIALFCITFVSVHYVFGFFGIVSLSICIALTTVVAFAWYVVLVQVVMVILLLFVIINMKFHSSQGVT